MEQVQYAIEIVNQWGQPMKKFRSEVASMDRMKVKDPFRDMPRSINQLRSNLERYKKLQAGAFRSDHVRKYNMLIGETEKKIRMLEGASKSAIAKTNMLGGAMNMLPAVGVAGGIMLATRKVTSFTKESLLGSAAFEKYNTTLRTMLGSQGAARERMSEYADIAKKTPFELRQVVEAGNQLQAIGRYSRGNVTMLGDLAAASGKPIEQVMNAYAKLSTGQKGEAVNMFRDLLISSEDWAKATGKGIKKNGELAATTEEMISALPKILKKKGFFGMMDQQSKTTEGKISNLSDSMDMLKVAVGDNMKPAFDSFLTGTTGIVENMTKWVEVPVPEKIAREKAELNALVGVITDANTGEQVRSDLINDLQQQYPEFLSGIDLETVKNEELRKKLAEVNKEYESKLRLASMKGLYSEVEEDYEKAKTKLGDAQLALYAKNEFTKSRGDIISIMNSKGFADMSTSITANSVLADNVSRAIKGYYNGNTLNYNESDIQKLIEWSSNYSTYQKFDSMWSSPESAVQKYSAELAILQQHKDAKGRMLSTEEHKALLDRAKRIDTKDKSTYDKLFGSKKLASEFSALTQKGLSSFDTVSSSEWERLASFLNGDLKYGSGTGGTGSGLDMTKAAATISGGGRSVKQINIHFDALISGVTNQFRDTDTVDDAENFLEKLSTALQMVVNDTNYSAG